MMLDLLLLIVMSNLHLLFLESIDLLLQSPLLISECFQGKHNLLDLTFPLLNHIFHFLVVLIETVTFGPAILLKLQMHIDLPILDLNQFSQSLTVLLQCLILLSQLLLLYLLLLGLGLV